MAARAYLCWCRSACRHVRHYILLGWTYRRSDSDSGCHLLSCAAGVILLVAPELDRIPGAVPRGGPAPVLLTILKFCLQGSVSSQRPSSIGSPVPRHVVGLHLLAGGGEDAEADTAQLEAGSPVESFDVFCLAQRAGEWRMPSTHMSGPDAGQSSIVAFC